MFVTAIVLCLLMSAAAQTEEDRTQREAASVFNEIKSQLRQQLTDQLYAGAKGQQQSYSDYYRSPYQHTGPPVEEKYNNLESRLGRLEATIAILQKKLIVCDSKVAVTQSQVSLLDQQVVEVDSQLQKLQGSLSSVNKLIANVAKLVGAIDKRVDAIETESRNGSATTALDQVKTQLAKQQLTTRNIQANVRILQAKEKRTNTQIRNLNQLVKASQSQGAARNISFLADLTTFVSQSSFTLVLDRVRYDHSPAGSSYNASTGEYTVPVDGVYAFTASVQLEDTSAPAQLQVRVDGKLVTYSSSTEPASDSSFFSTLIVTSQLELETGRKVSIYVRFVSHVQGDKSDDMDTWFGGHLIHT